MIKKNETFESSCINCEFWKEFDKSNRKAPPSGREGSCSGKYNGDYVTGNQYCLGFQKKR